MIGGTEITPANARFFVSTSPVVIHIISSAIYALLGAFQFVSRLWQRGIKWHRWVGRLLLPFGLMVGLSGLWMTLFYPYPQGTSDLLYILRLFFGSGMVLSIILGFISIRRRNVPQHRAWMTRAYAIGMLTRDTKRGMLSSPWGIKMEDERRSNPGANQRTVYQFKLKGHLSQQWMEWFEGLTVTLEEDGNTLLSGTVMDQSALHGVLKKIRDLGMPLLSVIPVESGRQDISDVNS